MLHKKYSSQKFRNTHSNTSVLEPFLNDVATLKLIPIKETLKRVFSCEYCEIVKSTYYEEHLWTAASLYDEYLTCNFI